MLKNESSVIFLKLELRLPKQGNTIKRAREGVYGTFNVPYLKCNFMASPCFYDSRMERGRKYPSSLSIYSLLFTSNVKMLPYISMGFLRVYCLSIQKLILMVLNCIGAIDHCQTNNELDSKKVNPPLFYCCMLRKRM
ncbi:hypothetical protein NPIL_310341 [Nephila pilipes]|uniref:Uncharacterized protein n=1 Tax=Nephila pilipes TaxID=299642 RepID=A0A8X6P4X5_NEPPI|nr:hypothetical protein NPIL_310341 [Nephila pilipes]